MNQSDFNKLAEATFQRIRDLTSSKGIEYRAGDDDQLANFKRLSGQLKLLPEKVLWVYLTKHLDGILNFVNTGTQPSEGVGGRINDAILYLILLKAIFTESTEMVPGREIEYPAMRTCKWCGCARYSRNMGGVNVDQPGTVGDFERQEQSRMPGDFCEAGIPSGDCCAKPGCLWVAISGSNYCTFHGGVDTGAARHSSRPQHNALVELQREISNWADKVFPNRTVLEAIHKLALEEIPELVRNPASPEEYADVIILALDIATLNRIDVYQAVMDKMVINRAAKWLRDPLTGTMKRIKTPPAGRGPE